MNDDQKGQLDGQLEKALKRVIMSELSEQDASTMICGVKLLNLMGSNKYLRTMSTLKMTESKISTIGKLYEENESRIDDVVAILEEYCASFDKLEDWINK